VSLDGNGDATLATSSLPIGTDNLSAVYSGDSNYSGSTGYSSESIGDLTVTTLSSSANPVTTGSSVTFTANVVGSPQSDGVSTGFVFFYASSPFGRTPIGQEQLDSNGDASVTVTVNSSEGVFAVYSPPINSQYLSSTSNAIKEQV
jgi:hypothetical protein